jgi:hypothetical protein
MTIQMFHNTNATVQLNFGIELFRAQDRLEDCITYLRGHHEVLRGMGIKTVFSSDPKWIETEGVWVVQLKDLDTGKIIGGERIHLKTQEHSLPFVKAIEKESPEVKNLVNNYAIRGTGELCGLWVSRKYARMGITNIMTQFGVAAAKILRLNSLFIFCADYTLGPVDKAGFTVIESLGEKGTFRYPLPDMTATVLQIKDLNFLDLADERFRLTIEALAETPKDQLITAIENFSYKIEYILLPELMETFAFKKPT